MKRFGKFMFGALAAASAAAGAYYLYKTYIKKDSSDDFEDFEDDFEDFDSEEEPESDKREYVPINITPAETAAPEEGDLEEALEDEAQNEL